MCSICDEVCDKYKICFIIIKRRDCGGKNYTLTPKYVYSRPSQNVSLIPLTEEHSV